MAAIQQAYTQLPDRLPDGAENLRADHDKMILKPYLWRMIHTACIKEF